MMGSGLTFAIRPQQEMLFSQEASKGISADVEPRAGASKPSHNLGLSYNFWQ
jgi:hypothetical protein